MRSLFAHPSIVLSAESPTITSSRAPDERQHAGNDRGCLFAKARGRLLRESVRDGRRTAALRLAHASRPAIGD
jgi:hypothetical protein